jgi:hypothetical protein
MLRTAIFGSLALAAFSTSLLAGDSIVGKYVEVRTCQVYTGPCFANGEVGLAGKNAIMTWRIDRGDFAGVDLTGRSATLLVKTSHTLGFNGFDDAESIKAVIVVDRQADEAQQAALKNFVLAQSGIAEDDVASVKSEEIELHFDMKELTATVDVDNVAHIETRKARKGDCICSNESAYYPPLVELFQFVPGVTIEGDVTARTLGTRWSVPDSRTAYLGIFNLDSEGSKLASRL